ncbi:MAG: transcription antitermination protein NusB, partial [Isosphaeraceae bacterium]
MSRSRGREIVLQALYQRDINPGIGARNISNFLKKRLKYRQDQVPFARDLLAGVQDNLAELDSRIQLTAENWRIERMPVIDRNILRLGLYEILTGGDRTPPVVAVNEAVDL